MEKIYARDNKFYKLCNKLKEKKHRDSLGFYVIEGEHLLLEALKSQVKPLVIIFREGYRVSKELKDLIDGFKEDLSLRTMDSALFQSLAETQTPQGILGIVHRSSFDRLSFFEAVGNKPLVVLDRVQDPGNIGTIIRTAEAAGFGGIISIKGTGDVFSSKVIRATVGSIFRLPLLFVDSGEEVVSIGEEYNRKLVVSCVDGGKPYYSQDFGQSPIVVVGSEGQGVSPLFVEKADLKITIPMEGVESLNAAVATGIILYECVRQNSKL